MKELLKDERMKAHKFVLSEYTYNEEKDVDVCNRCKDEINENEEIHYPNDKAVCEYCIESKECDKLYNN